MKYFYNSKTKSIITYTNFEPTTLNDLYELSEAQYTEYQTNIKNGYKASFNVENNAVVISYTLKENWAEKVKQRELNKLRAKRKPLLEAFDKYKSNVNYGIVVETETARDTIVAWYNDLLNLVETAFNTIPSEIQYYL